MLIAVAVSISFVKNTANRCDKRLTLLAQIVNRAIFQRLNKFKIQRRMHWRMLPLLACLPFAQPLLADTSCADHTHASLTRVRQVIDGDTLRLEDGHLLRMIGINAPEIDHYGSRSEPLSKQARELLKKAIGSEKQVWLVPDSQSNDRHQRRLAHVLSQRGENLQSLLLSQGMAFRIAIAPNLRWQNCYRIAEQQARQQRLGVWQNAYYQPHGADAVKPGFQRLKVTPTKIKRRGSWIRLQVNPQLDLRIQRKNLQYFPKDLHKFLRPIVVSGWVSERKGHFSMQLSHASAIEIVEHECCKGQENSHE